MPNNNPSGENGLKNHGGFGGETAYGAVKRLEESTKAAPLPTAPGVNAPKRAQRRAVKGQQPQAPPPDPVGQVAAAPPPPAAVWAEVAQIPGISPLAVEWANGG